VLCQQPASTPIDNDAILSQRVAYRSCNYTSECVFVGDWIMQYNWRRCSFSYQIETILCRVARQAIQHRSHAIVSRSLYLLHFCQYLRLYDVEVKITDEWRNIMGVEGTWHMASNQKKRWLWLLFVCNCIPKEYLVFCIRCYKLLWKLIGCLVWGKETRTAWRITTTALRQL